MYINKPEAKYKNMYVFTVARLHVICRIETTCFLSLAAMGDAEGPANNASGEALESANHAKKPLKTPFKHHRELGLLESG